MSESSDILKEVYEASDKQPNTVPENQLGAKAKKNSALYNALLVVIAAVAVVAVVCLVIYLTRFIGKDLGNTTSTATESTVSEIVKPSLVSDKMDGTNCIITLQKGTYDIAWDKIYAKDSSGTSVSPVSYDEAASTVTFSLEKGTLNIYIPDVKGNETQLVLQPSS